MTETQINKMHAGSKDTYDFIAQWISPELCYSTNDRWGRFGFLGVFADYVVSCTPGNIAEIGVGESSIYLTQVANKYGRKIFHCDIAPSKITNPLSVPGYLSEYNFLMDEQEARNWAGKISLPLHSPSCLLYVGTSDSFFQNIETNEVALFFIDGDHNYEQVKKDFYNAMEKVVENGYVVLHDTSPMDEEYLSEHRCGDVYRLRQEIEQNKSFDCLTLPQGTAMDVGLTIVRKCLTSAPHWKQKI